MSDRAEEEGNTEKDVAGGEDHISALPDDVLRYLMSFLLSRETVRTCVLAKRWRTLWKSVPALRIEYHQSHEDEGARVLNMFVDQLIRLRDPTRLNICDINFVAYEDLKTLMYWSDFDGSVEEYKRLDDALSWLQYALSCQVQVLRVRFSFWTPRMTLISSHLKILEFDELWSEGCSLDFSSCQVLEVLKLKKCHIYVNISSQSLQHLTIDSSFFHSQVRIHIFAPNLISFRLAAFSGLAPFLDSMQSLVTASVTLGGACVDRCSCGNPSCEGCDVQTINNESSMVFKSLSGAMNLELTTTGNMFVFRNYLKCHPLFDKLKTLLLNEWCMVDNFSTLVYFLHHSPILETLTIQLDFENQEEHHVIETDESYNSSVPSIISKHLKVVRIICNMKEDARVHRILMVLRTHGVPSEQIDIQ